jgi:myb proto-oncogene protein
MGRWTTDEDTRLKDAVQIHGGKNWVAIARLCQVEPKSKCWGRCKDVLDPSIDRKSGRAGKWTEDEDIKLKDAVNTHGGTNRNAIAAMVPGRTKSDCCSKRRKCLDL